MATRTAPQPGQPMTFEEAALLDPDENPGELDEGRWVPMTHGTWRHGAIVTTVGSILRQYARSNPGWRVAAGDPGTRLRRNPDTLRGPDVAVVRAERFPTGKGMQGWLEGAPELAVEVIGDSQSMSELLRKATQYLAAAGGKMVWILDPDPRLVVIVTPPSLVKILGPEETLDGGDVLPGFSCPVAELFE